MKKPYEEFSLEKARNEINVKEELPSNTKILLETMGLLKSSNSSIKEIKDRILLDESLTFFILKTANSAFYGTVKEISTLSHAISFLGYSNLRSIMMTYFTKNLLNKIKDPTLQKKQWKHSIFVAFASKALSKSYELSDPEEGYIAGLLHDIGKALIIKEFFNKYEKVIEKTNITLKDSIEGEKDIFGYTHLEVGYLLTKEWKMGKNIKYGVLYHHSPWIVEKETKLPAIISLFNKIAREKEYSLYKKKKENIEIEQEILSLKRVDIERIISGMEEEIENFVRIYG